MSKVRTETRKRYKTWLAKVTQDDMELVIGLCTEKIERINDCLEPGGAMFVASSVEQAGRVAKLADLKQECIVLRHRMQHEIRTMEAMKR